MLIGAAASTLKDGILNKKSFALTSGLAYVWTALLVMLPMTIGTPPWQQSKHSNWYVTMAKPTNWKDGAGFRFAWISIETVAKAGDIILARNGVSSSLNVRTTRYFTVAPRDTYLNHAVSGFRYGYPAERLALANFAQYTYLDGAKTYRLPEIANSLNLVKVNVVCLPQDRQQDIEFLRNLGYAETEKKTYYSYDRNYWFWCGRTNKYDY